MNPIFVDIHIHTSDDPEKLDENYNLDILVDKIKEFSNDSDFLISLTDHNTVNKAVYLEAVKREINIILGVELHIRNYNKCPAYHCHIFFDLEEISESAIDDINKHLDQLYPKKVVSKMDQSIPKIQDVINAFDEYDFMLLPHGGQSHAMFNTSIPKDAKIDTTLEKSIYYNQFEGFTARGNTKLELTQEYFKKLGIAEFVNLVTCSDNYSPSTYPKGKDKNAYVPTWMLAQPTFNGLRLSLSEQSRLIYSEEKPIIWSENIKSINHKRENIDIDVELTSGLNVVIGGSSSGKTLLVDSIDRKLKGRELNEDYAQYEMDKVKIDNPSGMTPHYLSQNYIMGVVNSVSDDSIEDIEIIKRVFPGDSKIKESINKGLRSLKTNIQDLVNCVQIIETETENLNKIPILSRLITHDKVENNVFEGLIPTEQEKIKMSFSEFEYDDFSNSLLEIHNFLERYPFLEHNSSLIDELQSELDNAYSINKSENQVRKHIEGEKRKYDLELKEENTEDQSKKQNFEKLLKSLKKYLSANRDFIDIINNISTYKLKFDSEEIKSMGHTLYIENDFELNTQKFLDVVNHFIKDSIADFNSIKPSDFFEVNFKKRQPKVRGYDDFEAKVYNKFEELNKKKYKIITKGGKKFENLSPGWKTSVILDIILGYDEDISPVIIDQPEDNLATNYINEGLVNAIKKIKSKKQIILVSHNATIPMLADAQNVVLCRNIENKLILRSSPLEGFIDGIPVVDHIAKITDGGKPSIKKRVKKYNLKKFNE